MGCDSPVDDVNRITLRLRSRANQGAVVGLFRRKEVIIAYRQELIRIEGEDGIIAQQPQTVVGVLVGIKW